MAILSLTASEQITLEALAGHGIMLVLYGSNAGDKALYLDAKHTEEGDWREEGNKIEYGANDIHRRNSRAVVPEVGIRLKGTRFYSRLLRRVVTASARIVKSHSTFTTSAPTWLITSLRARN